MLQMLALPSRFLLFRLVMFVTPYIDQSSTSPSFLFNRIVMTKLQHFVSAKESSLQSALGYNLASSLSPLILLVDVFYELRDSTSRHNDQHAWDLGLNPQNSSASVNLTVIVCFCLVMNRTV
jgi:hypothetical protein